VSVFKFQRTRVAVCGREWQLPRCSLDLRSGVMSSESRTHGRGLPHQIVALIIIADGITYSNAAVPVFRHR
jgi:hypothetical protein